MTVSRLINRNVVAERGRTSAVRVFVLSYFREAATEAGHHAAGHGTLAVNGHMDPERNASGSGVSEPAARVAVRADQSAASWPL